MLPLAAISTIFTMTRYLTIVSHHRLVVMTLEIESWIHMTLAAIAVWLSQWQAFLGNRRLTVTHLDSMRKRDQTILLTVLMRPWTSWTQNLPTERGRYRRLLRTSLLTIKSTRGSKNILEMSRLNSKLRRTKTKNLGLCSITCSRLSWPWKMLAWQRKPCDLIWN